jgi:hypothetical protein
MAVTALIAVGGLACSNDPFAIPWTESPDTVLLYSLARPELNLVSGFNFNTGASYRIESANATGKWDVALDTRGGQLVFLPPGALGVTSRARITTFPGEAFEDVVRAPTDTLLYTANDPVPVQAGTIYVFRTGSSPGVFGTNCVYYAKAEAVNIDVAGGTLSFVFDASPICNDLRLVPPG